MAAIKCECVVPSCSHEGLLVEAETKEELTEKGWKGITVSTEHKPPQNRPRTHLGWCPKCVVKFAVE